MPKNTIKARKRLQFSEIALISYIVPALLALALCPSFGYSFSKAGKEAILASVISTACGYVLSRYIKVGVAAPLRRKIRFNLIIGKAVLFVGVAAVFLDYIRLGRIPILNGGAGRIALQENILWNVYIVCIVGVVLYSRESIGARQTLFGRALIILYFAAAIASAWKGVFLVVLVAFFSPKVHGKSIKVVHLFIGVLLIGVLMFSINLIRTDFDFRAVLAQPIYYLIWGFVNFDSQAINYVGECATYSTPFLGCKFEVQNYLLVIPSYNVFTALSPLYIDGGVVLISVFFFLAAIVLRVAEKRNGALLNDYVFFTFSYFFLMADNGYAFYSKSFSVIIMLLLLLKFVRWSGSSDRSPRFSIDSVHRARGGASHLR